MCVQIIGIAILREKYLCFCTRIQDNIKIKYSTIFRKWACIHLYVTKIECKSHATFVFKIKFNLWEQSPLLFLHTYLWMHVTSHFQQQKIRDPKINLKINQTKHFPSHYAPNEQVINGFHSMIEMPPFELTNFVDIFDAYWVNWIIYSAKSII